MFSMQILIFSIIVLWLYVLWTRRRYYQLMLKIPGPWGYPLLGIAHEVRNKEKFIKVLEYYEKKTSDHCFLTWLGPSQFFVVADPQIAQDLLTSPNCINRTVVGSALGDAFGPGLFSSRDIDWSRQRKLLNPSFSNKVLMNFFPIFNEETEKLLTTVKDYCGCGDVNVFEILKKFTFTLTSRTMMDRDITYMKTTNDKHYAEQYEYLVIYVIDAVLSPWMRFKFMQKLFRFHPAKNETKRRLDEFATKLINKRIDDRKASQTEISPSNKKNNFINLALKLLDKGDFTYQNVVDQTHNMIAAGSETTKNVVGYILTILAVLPEYQEKLFEELRTFYPDPDNFDVTLADIQEMVYLDMVINEAMRIMPPIAALFRELSDDVKLSNGIKLPKGLRIVIDAFNMQRRTDIWGPEAHIFNPENFLPSNLEKTHSYGSLPFGKGVRICIGWKYALLSMKVALAKLIRNYQFTTDFKFENLEFVFDVNLKFKVMPKVKICRRNI